MLQDTPKPRSVRVLDTPTPDMPRTRPGHSLDTVQTQQALFVNVKTFWGSSVTIETSKT